MLSQAYSFPWFKFELQGYLRSRVFHKLKNIRNACLFIHDDTGHHIFGDQHAGLKAEITVLDNRFYRELVLGGSVGAGEAFMDNLWLVDDLTNLVRIMVRNQDVMDVMEEGGASVKSLLMRAMHFLNRNTIGGSRRNIAAHYDLGNKFFELFLDKHMMYSSAIFRSETDSLEKASECKLKTICHKLEISENDHLLEIGSGWGGFAVYAARHFGCRVTTTTISEQQHKETISRVNAAGLQGKVTVLKKDYRDLEGRYDKLVSIEMVEAVGHQYLEIYFLQCRRLLKPDGRMLLQAITIEDNHYEQALHSVDFIKRYIFPGSFIPSASILSDTAAVNGLDLLNFEDIGLSYALTLKHWQQRFMDKLDQVVELGYSQEFIRMWLFYFSYCEGGFLERSISNVQMVFEASE